MQNKQQLRQLMRARRQALTRFQQIVAARQIRQRIAKKPPFLRSKRIAFYLANDGEVNPLPLLELAAAQSKRCYLPVICRNNSLRFAAYKPGDKLVKNRFNIPEPLKKRFCPAHRLDLVLLPLVAFSAQGARLGMGGGFYDRSFAFKNTRSAGSKPQLIGLAHQCQQMDSIPVESWDIALDMVVTDGGVWQINGTTCLTS